MVIEIDDTAWGLPVDGVCLGFYRIETGEVFIKKIGVEFFQGDRFAKKDYLKEALKKAKEALFKDLNVQHDEEIHICSGYVLSTIYDWLDKRGFKSLKRKITGVLQRTLEGVSRDMVDSLPNFSKTPSEPLYDALIRWFLKDEISRRKYMKTGWKSIKELINTD